MCQAPPLHLGRPRGIVTGGQNCWACPDMQQSCPMQFRACWPCKVATHAKLHRPWLKAIVEVSIVLLQSSCLAHSGPDASLSASRVHRHPESVIFVPGDGYSSQAMPGRLGGVFVNRGSDVLSKSKLSLQLCPCAWIGLQEDISAQSSTLSSVSGERSCSQTTSWPLWWSVREAWGR